MESAPDASGRSRLARVVSIGSQVQQVVRNIGAGRAEAEREEREQCDRQQLDFGDSMRGDSGTSSSRFLSHWCGRIARSHAAPPPLTGCEIPWLRSSTGRPGARLRARAGPAARSWLRARSADRHANFPRNRTSRSRIASAGGRVFRSADRFVFESLARTSSNSPTCSAIWRAYFSLVAVARTMCRPPARSSRRYAMTSSSYGRTEASRST